MNTLFLDACLKKKTAYTPVWFMRQAGRYLPQYRNLKGDKNILDIVRSPDLASQIAMQPVDILGVDAAILYADIMIPLVGIGVDLGIIENIGPVIKNPIKDIQDVKKLRTLMPQEDIDFLGKTIKILRNDLKVPLIGFSAAPFTLAGYLVEGKPSRDFMKTKSLMYQDPKAWNLLMDKLTKLIITYLRYQAKSGIQAIQIFDSWVGYLSETDYMQYVHPHSKKIFESLQSLGIPLIHFGTNTAGMLTSFASVKCDVIGIDWRISIDKAWKTIGYKKAIQGNLDPVVLTSGFAVIKNQVDKIFDLLPRRTGYIFNLGHGVLPSTSAEDLKRLTEYVHGK